MIKKIDIIHYRKLINLNLTFSKNINAISGTNGTCKTSLLHIFGNSMQAPTKNNAWILDGKCLPIINAVNSVVNPKIESLTRGDQKYNDPAHGVQGILFTVDYFENPSISFRRHNSRKYNSKEIKRYAIKPKYSQGKSDMLPSCPVIYLGLSRLVPFGEFQNDDILSNIRKRLPVEYQKEIAELYYSFTNYEINFNVTKQMGDIKVRNEFSSNVQGVDSNTISAGEDNLSIILTALVSLKYYYDSIESHNTVESVLLIDEIDATLHPAYQIKLLNLFRDMSKLYKIQIVFTTHSMSLLEEMIEKKDNVIYLLDNITSVVQMEEPDIYKIKMHLQSITKNDIYAEKVITLFTEDDEARFILTLLFDYLKSVYPNFRNALSFFHFVHAKIGADNLYSIFSDSKLLHTTIRSICILDGDHDSDLKNCIISLPGNKSPEQLLFDYAEKLYEDDDPFWTAGILIDKGYGKPYYINNIKNKINEFNEKLKETKESGKSTKGMVREFNKKLFIDEKSFFELLFKNWMHNPDNKQAIDNFYNELHILFLKVAPYHEINPKEWSSN